MEVGNVLLVIQLQEIFWILVEKSTFHRKSLLISYWREIEPVVFRDAEDRGNVQILITHRVGKVVAKPIQQILDCYVAGTIE